MEIPSRKGARQDACEKLEARRAEQVAPVFPQSFRKADWGWCLPPQRLPRKEVDAGVLDHHKKIFSRSLSTSTLKLPETRREAERVLGATFDDRVEVHTPNSETSSQGARRRITEIEGRRHVPKTCNQIYGSLHKTAEPVVVKHRITTCDECLFVDALTKSGRLHCPEIRFGGIG
mmetsp:Transcript_10797/g.17774  ORF Transcript_10797/g.17774 Transcript_10797/m.17774 type:complete len:175 (-) Transcript_10797:99-623(-)|eukprot:CAMPEP_0169076926 /NCGR_PEP_ID=MMETSP1015-20121227/8608_1 /TAXON_ID=342587 /ORGANISM="Karlodinium micrum, Strain CCMP2283" /LENGTH=174 /DNA_ID=CAMNT_0009136421 /DNA_START=44 /DNA_END=568 /DNA_ORIENTATION=+